MGTDHISWIVSGAVNNPVIFTAPAANSALAIRPMSIVYATLMAFNVRWFKRNGLQRDGPFCAKYSSSSSCNRVTLVSYRLILQSQIGRQTICWPGFPSSAQADSNIRRRIKPPSDECMHVCNWVINLGSRCWHVALQMYDYR